MGRGKSGSTILGVALGNCSEIFFAGELASWLLTGGEPNLGGAERLQFWDRVREDVGGELFGSEAFHHLERALSVFRPDRWALRRRLRARYQGVTEDLYRSIARRAGATHIVDSSHLPMRARELQRLSGIDLYLVFMVRNTESIVASYTRGRKRPKVRFFMTNGRLWVTYALSVYVFLRQRADRRLLLRYEDFVANADGFLREILEFVGSSAEVPNLESLNTGIPLKGNPLIRTEVVALKAQAPSPHRTSLLMRLAERPWALVLKRLHPAATGARSRPPVSTDPG